MEACLEMLTCVNGAPQASERCTSLLASGTTTKIDANSFEKQLLNMLQESLASAAENIGKAESTNTQAASQNETIESAKSQFFVSCTRSADGQAAASSCDQATDADASTSVTESTSASTEPEALAKLKTALEAAGHKPDDYNLVYEDQTVWYPGGSYQNRIIRATFSEGYQESYGADLTNESPNATVLSIEHTLRDIAAGDYS